MRPVRLSILMCLLCLPVAAMPTPPAPPRQPVAEPPAAGLRPIVEANTAFAVDLWKQVGARKGNLAVSPASISAALAMTWTGAKGETASQIGTVLHLSGDANAAASAWGRLIPALEDPTRGTLLRIANRIYAQQGLAFKPAFLANNAKSFGAGFERVDFAKATDAARVHINAWVAQRTQQRIRDLLGSNDIDRSTRMVLVDAIYFLGRWADPFEAADTKPEGFDVAPDRRHDVPTMHLTGALSAAQVADAKVLALDYQEGHVQMLFVLPDRTDGLDELERGLTAGTIGQWTSALAWKPKVIVSLPKFRIDPVGPVKLREALQALGLRDAFDRSRADFDGIARPRGPNDRLFIGDVVHKANVSVDEEGAEAAAATAVVMTHPMGIPVGPPPPPPAPFVFKADHPFLFVIRDVESGMVLFIGRVSDPAAP